MNVYMIIFFDTEDFSERATEWQPAADKVYPSDLSVNIKKDTIFSEEAEGNAYFWDGYTCLDWRVFAV